MKFFEKDFHPHILKRMNERGITKVEIVKTMNDGKVTDDSKIGTFGKSYVFEFNNKWGNKFYKYKEVKVYYKIKSNKIIILTAISRYGNDFSE